MRNALGNQVNGILNSKGYEVFYQLLQMENISIRKATLQILILLSKNPEDSFLEQLLAPLFRNNTTFFVTAKEIIRSSLEVAKTRFEQFTAEQDKVIFLLFLFIYFRNKKKMISKFEFFFFPLLC